MTILIQAWFAVQPHTGIGNYTLSLAQTLAEQHPEVVLKLLLPQKITLQKQARNVQTKVLTPWEWIPHAGLKKALWESVQVPFYLWKESSLKGVLFAPYPSPLFNRILPQRCWLTAMTAHDTFLWSDPRYKGTWFKRIYHRLCRLAFQNVQRPITISQTVAEELKKPPYCCKNVQVILNGKPSWAEPAQATHLSHGKELKKTLLYVGGFDARKQVEKLLLAFAACAETRSEWELKLVGTPPEKLQTSVEALQKKGYAIQILGPQKEDALKLEYQRAWAFVHASDAEGFNLPLVEAMSMGLPAVVSDRAIHREISQNTARFWDPSQSETLFAKLRELEDPAAYEAQKKAQLHAAKNYSWDQAAQELFLTLNS